MLWAVAAGAGASRHCRAAPLAEGKRRQTDTGRGVCPAPPPLPLQRRALDGQGVAACPRRRRDRL